jgi:metal-responsive CopG/Arc/MetJ family transcriptional regulator
MKTAISIPNPIFEAAEQLAQDLGMSRSELYATAIAAYVKVYHHENVTERLNQVYTEESSELEPGLVQLQIASLDEQSW